MAALALAALLTLSLVGLSLPAAGRCLSSLGSGCPGASSSRTNASTANESQWFDVKLYDYGFWVVNSVSGANESNRWTVFEGYDIHLNATSLPPNPSVGGTSAHGLGLLGGGINVQVFTSIGSWTSASFIAPNQSATGVMVYCVNYCGSGHNGMHVNILNVAPATPAPVAQLSAAPTRGTVPLTVNFSATATNGTPPYTMVWSFGDGTHATGANVSHVYVQPGTYTASVTAYDVNGLGGGASTSISASLPPAINVSVSAAPTDGPAPLEVSFTASASNGTAPYSFNWSFGDGASGHGVPVSHTYSNRGQYYAQVIVTDATGRSGDAFVLINVSSAVPSPLVVRVTVVPTEGDLPLNISATASLSGGGGSYGSVSWTFGDGASATGSVVQHTYRLVAPGVVALRAEGTDSIGQRASATVNVTLYPGASGSLFTTLSRAQVPVIATFHLRLVGGNGSYAPVHWDFGDGSTVLGLPNATHQYTQAGDHRVSASTADSTGAAIVVTGWVNLSSATPTHGGITGALPNDNSPLYFLAAFAGSGLLMLVASAWWERREPPRDEEEGPSGDPIGGPAGYLPPEGEELNPEPAGSARAAGALPRRGFGPAFGTLAVGSLLYWSWSILYPDAPYTDSGSLLGNLLFAAWTAVLVLGVMIPLHRRLPVRAANGRRYPGRVLAGFAVTGLLWFVATGSLAWADPSSAGLTVGTVLLPLHGPFGTWASVQFLLSVPPLAGYLTVESATVAAMMAYLSVGALRLAWRRFAPEVGRLLARPLGAPGIASGALAWVAALGSIAGCCSTPLLIALTVAPAAGPISLPLSVASSDLVDGVLWLGSVGLLSLSLRQLTRRPPARTRG